MTRRKGPAPIDIPPPPKLTVKQANALLRLRNIVLNFPDAIAPTRATKLNMATLRALERKGLVHWRRLTADAQGVYVTPEGDAVANVILATREAARDASLLARSNLPGSSR